MKRAHSIVVPIVLLVVAAVAIATAAQFVITFNGPPPFPPPVRITDIAQGLRDGAAPPRSRVTISMRTADAELPGGGEASSETDAAVAHALGVPPASVRGRYEITRRPGPDAVIGQFAIAWSAPDGVRIARRTRPPLLTSWHLATLGAALAMLLALGIAAWWIARAISRPIRRLAAVATATRPGSRTPIPREGPREVRELAAALEAMQARILEQAEGRTAMLTAIAHDLGTPLSRLAFWIEQLPETARERAAGDVDEMRSMLGEVLRFGREARSDAPRERIELGSLIESLADDLSAAGMPVEAAPGQRAIVRGDPAALRRLFANLFENAVRYGGRAAVAWSVEGGWAEARIDDAGPGFGSEPEALFAPFVRGEASRNRATGGTGLGLTIVRSIVEAHGGRIALESRESGGRVRVRLPLA